MRTRKRKLNAALLISAALGCAMLLFTGCPGAGSPEPSTPPNENQEYDIVIWDKPPDNGDIEISPRRAARGATITITLQPNAGFEPDNLRVFNPSNYSIPYTGSGYTYTFTMQASEVRVSVAFVSLDKAIENATTRLTMSSSWDDIDALNSLLKKPTTQSHLNEINYLKGEYATNWNEAANSYDPEGTDSAPTRWKSLGLIRSKMRNTEDLTKWISLTWPLDSIKMGADIKNHKDSDSLGTDRTILYYVKENNPTFPVPVLGKGWQAGVIHTPTEAMFDALQKDLKKFDGIQEIPLVYEVGTNPDDYVKYTMLLWPVAQYTVQYDPGTSGNVLINEYWYDNTKIKSSITAEEIDTTDFDEVQPQLTLNSRNLQGTGYVGKTPIITPPDTLNNPDDRQVFVRITPTQPNVLVSVSTSSGNLVRDILTGTLRTDISSDSSGYFYPESRQYTIRVRPQTPPAPFN